MNKALKSLAPFLLLFGIFTANVEAQSFTWESVNSGPYTLNGVAEAKMQDGEPFLVAVGSLGKILTSTTGHNWLSRYNPTGNQGVLYAAAGNAMGAVAVGNKGVILFSQNSVNWARVSNWSYVDTFIGVAASKNMFVAATSGGAVWYSTDGVSWNLSQAPELADGGEIHAITADRTGRFVMVEDRRLGSAILTSTNGKDWKIVYSNPNQFLVQATVKNSLSGVETFLAIGIGLNGTCGVTSPDGITWTNHSDYTMGAPVNGLTANADQFLGVREHGEMVTSTDGIGWNPETSGTTNFLFGATATTIDNNKFVVVGDNGTILLGS